MAQSKSKRTNVKHDDIDFSTIVYRDHGGLMYGSQESAEYTLSTDDQEPVAGAEVQRRVAAQFNGRQWLSRDLVGHAFGDVVPIPLAACIMLLFLHHGVLTVAESDPGADHTEYLEKPVGRRRWANVCIQAARRVHHQETSSPGVPMLGLEDRYIWSWADPLQADVEQDVVNFINVVGALAFACASAISPKFGTSYSPTIRFATLPRPHRPSFPLPNQQEDLHPDFFALPLSAFRDAAEEERIAEFHQVTSPLRTICEVFPHLLSKTSTPHFSVSCPTGDDNFSIVPTSGDPPSQTLDERLATPPMDTQEPTSFQGYDSLDWDSSQDDLVDDDALRSLLQRLLRATETNEVTVGIPPEVADKLHADYLDTSYACWPGIRLSGQDRCTSKSAGILQSLVYMQEQYCTQPYLRFVVSLAFTKRQVVFLRADPLGVERCELEKGSTVGVMNIIRLVLGLTVADDDHLGVDPAFDFRQATSPFTTAPPRESMPPVSTTTHTTSASSVSTPPTTPKEFTTSTGATKRGGTDETSPTAKRQAVATPSTPEAPAQYTYREATFMTIPGVGRYFLVRLIDGRRSIVGRSSRLWEAYRERPDGVFEGPFVLKSYYADVSTPAYQHDIIEKLMASGPDERKRYLFLPDKMIKLGSVLKSVRGFDNPEELPPLVQSISDRVEIVTVSPMKRTLSQYKDVSELVHAFRDVYRAIGYLAELGYLHQDVSLGNILLAKDDLSRIPGRISRAIRIFPRGADTPTRTTITLVRRKAHQLGNVHGLLHDFDMAGLLHPPQVHRSFQTGTLPYMSVRTLSLDYERHSLADDIESIFYAAYLLPFTFDKPTAYPATQDQARWPACINKWANGQDLDSLSALKSQYFSSATRWLEPFVAAEVLPYWKDTEEGRIWRDLLVELHDNAVWLKVMDASGWVQYNTRREQHVDLACAAIDRVIEQHHLAPPN